MVSHNNSTGKLLDDWPCPEMSIMECLYYCNACSPPKIQSKDEILNQIVRLLKEVSSELNETQPLNVLLQEGGGNGE